MRRGRSEDIPAPSNATMTLLYSNDITIFRIDFGARAREILEVYSASLTLLDKNGYPIENKTARGSNMAWWISYTDYRRVCGNGVHDFDFANFYLQFTSCLRIDRHDNFVNAIIEPTLTAELRTI